MVDARERWSDADPDAELLARVAAGDAAAFEDLVRRHQDRVLGVCQRLLGDREEARDAAQEVFLKVFRKAGSYRPRGKVYTWLYRIAVNHCLNRLRRRKVVRFLSFGALGETGGGPAGGALATDPPDPAPDPHAALEARRRWAATRRAIDRLPEGQRAVLVLAKLEGLAYKEIAEVLGITVGAVESRLFRAMRTLEASQDMRGPGVS
ncbi:MAG TPA: RNA polymerase sigma factor [Thermoanaerobaculia bacterium]|nr:RNA polymerase sigma factor [Thermoanaerobaculia bacterium]